MKRHVVSTSCSPITSISGIYLFPARRGPAITILHRSCLVLQLAQFPASWGLSDPGRG